MVAKVDKSLKEFVRLGLFFIWKKNISFCFQNVVTASEKTAATAAITATTNYYKQLEIVTVSYSMTTKRKSFTKHLLTKNYFTQSIIKI